MSPHDPTEAGSRRLRDQTPLVRVLLTLTGLFALGLLALPSLPTIHTVRRQPAAGARPPAASVRRLQPAPLAPVHALADQLLELDGRTLVPGAFLLREELAGGSESYRGSFVDPATGELGVRLGLDLVDGRLHGVIQGLGAWRHRRWSVEGAGLDDLQLTPGQGDRAQARDMAHLSGGGAGLTLEESGSLFSGNLDLGPLGSAFVGGTGRWSEDARGWTRGTLELLDPSSRRPAYLLELTARPVGASEQVDAFLTGLGEHAGTSVQLELEGERSGSSLLLAGESLLHSGLDHLGLQPDEPISAELELELERSASRTSVSAPLPEVGLSSLRDASCMALEEVARNLVPVEPLLLEELEDGTGRLHGLLQDSVDRRRRFELDLLLVGRLPASALAAEVAPAPLLELAPAAYVEAGGPCDPSRWCRYEAARGVLRGRDAFEGAELVLRSRAPLQLGHGASGMAREWGLLVPLDAEVRTAPRVGSFPEGSLGAVLRGRLEPPGPR